MSHESRSVFEVMMRYRSARNNRGWSSGRIISFIEVLITNRTDVEVIVLQFDWGVLY
jgi:hypothetical protein